MTTELLICAHCHRPYEFTRGRKTVVNGGTVGIPCNGQTAAQFILAESAGGGWKTQLISVPYDNEAVVAEFYESGLIDLANVWSRTIIAMLKTGRHYNKECLQLIRRLCEERGEDFGCEEIWREAAETLGI